MYRLLLLMAMIFCLSTGAQKKDSPLVDLQKLKQHIDSSNKMMDSLNNAAIKRMQDEEYERTLKNMDRNNDAFMAMQRENESRQRKQMWIRIALGALFAGIFAVGISRRKKKVS